MDSDNNVYGEDRLEELIARTTVETDVKKDVLTILSDVNEFAASADQSDDITIMQINFGKTDNK